MEPKFLPHVVHWTPQKVTSIWNYYSSNRDYDQQRFSSHSGYQIIKWVKNQINLNEAKVLDFGCGTGDLLKHILDNTSVRASYGIEFSEESLNKTKEKLKNEKRFNGAFSVDEIKRNLNSSVVDVMLLIEVFEHLNDKNLKFTLSIANELIKNNGFLVITTPNNENIKEKMII